MSPRHHKSTSALGRPNTNHPTPPPKQRRTCIAVEGKMVVERRPHLCSHAHTQKASPPGCHDPEQQATPTPPSRASRGAKHHASRHHCHRHRPYTGRRLRAISPRASHHRCPVSAAAAAVATTTAILRQPQPPQPTCSARRRRKLRRPPPPIPRAPTHEQAHLPAAQPPDPGGAGAGSVARSRHHHGNRRRRPTSGGMAASATLRPMLGISAPPPSSLSAS
jgi:hypothetical protein